MSRDLRRLIVVTGLSGAGKTVVLNALEDLGYYCIDNLPIGLWPALAREIHESGEPLYSRVAIGIDARNPVEALNAFSDRLRQAKGEYLSAELIFMEASDETLLRRFSETRRRHPLSSDAISLTLAIREERRRLGPLSEAAALRIDTSRTSVHQLREAVRERIAHRDATTLSLQLVSFGFKHGVPADADFVFDVRCLPNPYWEPHLRDLTGRDPRVIAYLESAPLVGEVANGLCDFLDTWVPRFEADNRSYLTVAVGCTGGHHRSVYIVQRLADHCMRRDQAVLVSHRDSYGLL